MVWQNAFVMCVLVDGVPQKESRNGVVHIPFSKEYTLRFRNKNSRRAVVKFTMDGEEASGEGYVIQPHGYVDIERHHQKAVRFKFVDLDSPEAVDHGKNGPNYDGSKGLIEAKFYFEKERQYVPTPVAPWNPPPGIYPIVPPTYPWYTTQDSWPNLNNPDYSYKGSSMESNSMLRGHDSNSGVRGSSLGGQQYRKTQTCSIPPAVSCVPPPVDYSSLQDGVTVEGSSSNQTFRTVYIDLEDIPAATVRLVLRGSNSTTRKAKKDRPVMEVDDAELEALEAEAARLRRIKELQEEIARLQG